MGRDEDLLATAPTALCDGLSSAIRVVTPSASPMTTPRGPHTPRQLLAESRQEVNQVGSLRTLDVGFLLRLLFCCLPLGDFYSAILAGSNIIRRLLLQTRSPRRTGAVTAQTWCLVARVLRLPALTQIAGLARGQRAEARRLSITASTPSSTLQGVKSSSPMTKPRVLAPRAPRTALCCAPV